MDYCLGLIVGIIVGYAFGRSRESSKSHRMQYHTRLRR